MSKQEEIEEKIREQRTIEANKKGLIGQNGKIGMVLRMLGHPIIAQYEGGTYVDTNYLDLGRLDEEEPRNNEDFMKKIPTMDLGENQRPESEEWAQIDDPIGYSTRTIGWHFDGLSRGMHMEVKYDEETTEFSLYYKGYLAYKEVKGELLAYVPNEEWEGWIERLSKAAKELQRKTREKDFAEQCETAERNKKNWWQNIISRWGDKN